jgi:hypothetical protein
MEPSDIFNYLVLVFLLTTIFYVYLENKDNIKFPKLENQLKKESKHHFFVSLVISLVIVIIFMIIKNK